MAVKLFSGIVLLCLSAIWVVFWCSQVSTLLLGDYDGGDQFVFIVVAGLALAPVFWAIMLIDRGWHAPAEDSTPSKRLIVVPASKPPVEAEMENDEQLAS